MFVDNSLYKIVVIPLQDTGYTFAREIVALQRPVGRAHRELRIN